MAVGAVMPGAGDGYCLGVAAVVTTIGDPGTWPGCGWAFSLILTCVKGLNALITIQDERMISIYVK